MNETLWITLPTNEENALKNVTNLIFSKNLTDLSINQLIEKLENNQAAGWLEVLGQYNAIPSVNNINTSEMLIRAKGVRNKFELRGYPQLKDREFEPGELLSLIILCYSNPNLIGPKLTKALDEADESNIKKEMLENSARVGNRVAPWASNLRLLSTALYFNDTDIRLPTNVIDRVTTETIRDGRVVRKLDQRGGFEEWIDGPARARGDGATARMKRNEHEELDTYLILQSLQEGRTTSGEDHMQSQLDIPASGLPINYSGNGSELVTESLTLYGTNNAANSNSSYGNVLLIGSLALFQIARSSPVGAVVGNMGKDLAAASKYVGSFFSKNSECADQEQKTVLLSPTAKS